MEKIVRSFNPSELREFGFLFGGLTLLLFGKFLPWVMGKNEPQWPMWVFTVFFLAALIAPKALSGVHYIWMRFGAIMGALNAKILLSVFFFIAILPTGLLRRLFKDTMGKKPDKQVDSYRQTLTQTKLSRMENPY